MLYNRRESMQFDCYLCAAYNIPKCATELIDDRNLELARLLTVQMNNNEV